MQVDHDVERYTVGRDREMDLYLAPYDVLGSMAHITMLQSIGLLTAEELDTLTAELRNIYDEIEHGRFTIEEGVEDVHSQVELMLTRRLGDMGKKIHSGRSRNDQVLVDLRLFIRSEIEEVVVAMTRLSRRCKHNPSATARYLCRVTHICRWPCLLRSGCGSGLMPSRLPTTSL